MATWWVNQSTKKGLADNKTVWAPDTNKAGNKQWHWETMWEAAVGDTIFHYTDGFIVGTSTILEPAHNAPNPYPNNDMWTKSGKKIAVNFTPLTKPIAKTKIPLEMRTAATGKEGPFNMNGDVQQGYFFPLSDDLAQTIRNLK